MECSRRHGGKAKTDKIAAHKIAILLRGGMLPQAHVYPKGMRETRDLLRRRTFLVRRRAEALARTSTANDSSPRERQDGAGSTAEPSRQRNRRRVPTPERAEELHAELGPTTGERPMRG